jgi:hypothetical protein
MSEYRLLRRWRGITPASEEVVEGGDAEERRNDGRAWGGTEEEKWEP